MHFRKDQAIALVRMNGGELLEKRSKGKEGRPMFTRNLEEREKEREREREREREQEEEETVLKKLMILISSIKQKDHWETMNKINREVSRATVQYASLCEIAIIFCQQMKSAPLGLAGGRG